MANKFDPNGWDKSPSVNNGGFVPWAKGIDLTPEQKRTASENIGVVSDATVDQLYTDFGILEGRVNSAIGDIDTALDNIDTMSATIDSATTAVQLALDTVNTITGDFYSLSGKVDTNSADIATNSGNIATNSSDIATLSAKEYNDRTDIDTISGNVGTNTYNITQLNGKVGTISSTVGNIQTTVNGITGDVTTLSSDLNTVSGIATNALTSAADAVNKANAVSSQWTVFSGVVSGEVSGLKDDWSAFSATEDAVITAATAAIPGQVSAEVSGQLSGKQDKLVNSVNITVYDNKVDLHNNECSATPNSVAIGDKSKSINNYGFVHGRYATNAGEFNAMIAAFNETASGTYNLVAGNQNVVAGNWNTVVGSGNTVTANNFNFLQGVGNTVGNVQGAHAEGTYTISDTDYQHVEGRYNAPATGALHVIGNGTSTADRSNIVETYTDRVVVNGKNTNGYMQAVEELSNWVYDSTTGTKVQFDRPDFVINSAISSISGKKIGTNWFGPTYLTGPNQYYMTNGNSGTTIGITRWDGNPRRALAKVGNATIVTSWPGELPMALSADMQYFAFENIYVRNIDEQFTNIRDLIDAGVYAGNAFRGTRITADVVPLMDYIISAGYQSRWNDAFNSCYYIPNYSTLTASPTYSSFF